MAATHDLNQRMFNAAQQFATTAGTPRARAEAAAARQKIGSEDEEYRVKADRITTLLIANNCTPPDHVTTWFTYSASNPARKEHTPPN